MINRQYKIVKKIGEGRSRVFLCKDLDLDQKEVAIKILPLDSQEEERDFFKNEFLTLRRINHPNIIKCYDYGIAHEIENPAFSTYEGSIFFVLEYFDGVELLDLPEVYEEQTFRMVIKRISEALFYLHQSGYIHYDLKPENILVSNKNGQLDLRLIDLGFASKKTGSPGSIKGTAEYIAPELLRGEQHDHTVDLYALGIIIYKIIYGKFPFDAGSQIEIYKAQVEQEFTFPETKYSPEFISVLKKLLSKNPSDRYFSSLEVIRDLGNEIDMDITSNFLPVKCFAARKDVTSILRKYIEDKTSTEVFIIMGTEGAGKTSLFHILPELIQKSVLIENINRESGLKFIKAFLKKLAFSESLYPVLTTYEKEKFYRIVEGNSSDLRADIKSFMISVSLRNHFTVLLDDFDTYDDFTLGIMNEILPILQSNNIKVIISENSDKKSAAYSLHNRREVHLSSFMENELTDFLEMSYGSFFPKTQLKKSILLYADLLPGSIEAFIRDLLFFNILRYSGSEITLEFNEENEKLLKTSHEDIYQVRVSQLTSAELKAAQIISCFKASPDIKMLSVLISKDIEKSKKITESLEKKNILSGDPKSTTLIFSSSGIKDYIYSVIENKAELHTYIAGILEEQFSTFSLSEIARQFELASRIEESFKYLRKEIDEGEKSSSLTYTRSLLEHILNLPLDEDRKNSIKIELAQTMFALSDYKSSLQHLDELSILYKEEYIAQQLLGGSLIGIGELERGVSILRELLNEAPEDRKPGLLLSVASAELDLNNFVEAEDICKRILDNSLASVEEVGKSLNLLGLIKIYTLNDFDGALGFFSKAENVYKKGNHLLGVAQMQNNIANIHNMRGEFEKAESFWNKSLKINLEIGNLEQEATLLLNFGVLYFEKQEYDRTIYYYKRAHSIYSSLGNKLRENIVLVNLGEIHLVLCEYQEALSCLEDALYNLNILKNANEEAEALYLLCKVYLVIGDPANYKKYHQRYLSLHQEQSLPEKNNIYLRFLKVVSEVRFSSAKADVGDLRLARNYFLEQKEKLKFLESCFLIIKILLDNKNYNEVFLELESQSLIDNCRNMSAEAERLYYMSLLADASPGLKLEPAIDYLQRAYDQIKDMNIQEFTWKILYKLAEHYHRRGNYIKAEEYVIYCDSLIKFLAESLKDENLRKRYLDEPERKEAFEKLKKFIAHT